MLVDLEGHGREEIFEQVDLSRTVGWFTTLFPVLLVLDETDSLGNALKSIKEQLRRIPDHGIGYGVLRYLTGDAEGSVALRAAPSAELSFNYLGQLESVMTESSLFELAGESSGRPRSQRGKRSHLLEINAVVLRGRLEVAWIYSEDVHRRSTIDSLAQGFIEALKNLIKHCQSPDAGGYTPADFPLVKFSQQQLDKLIETRRRVRIDNQTIAPVVPNKSDPEFWPSVGEYFVYDEWLYHAMTNDRVRNEAYRRAIHKIVQGKSVVDIGSGADLVLARMCLEAGARRVYAIEMLPDAVQRAKRLAQQLDAGDRLVIIQSDSRSTQIPEQVDVCVSELIGTIGSSEGVIELLDDARRFLKPTGKMIPRSCLTWIAPVSLPDEMISSPRFREVPGYYAERVFERCERRFDIRVCVKNLPNNALLGQAVEFEALTFDGPISSEGSMDIALTVQRGGRLDGFLLWIELFVDADERIDVLHSETNWLPVFLPVFSPGIVVETRDVVQAVCSRLMESDGLTPDYVLRGRITRQGRTVADFNYMTRRNEDSYGANPFYRALWETSGSKRTDRRSPMRASSMRGSNSTNVVQLKTEAGGG